MSYNYILAGSSTGEVYKQSNDTLVLLQETQEQRET